MCGHEGDDAASLLAFLVACLRAMPTMAGKLSTYASCINLILLYFLLLSDRVTVTFYESGVFTVFP